jgi:hypothetical protein
MQLARRCTVVASMSRANSTLGAMLGLAAGDALGAQVEFAPPEVAREVVEHALEMVDSRYWAAGQWTDDTGLALELAESIAEHGLLDLDDLARRYIDWAARDGRGIGRSTRAALAGAADAGEASRRAAVDRDDRREGAVGERALERAHPVAAEGVKRAEVAGERAGAAVCADERVERDLAHAQVPAPERPQSPLDLVELEQAVAAAGPQSLHLEVKRTTGVHQDSIRRPRPRAVQIARRVDQGPELVRFEERPRPPRRRLEVASDVHGTAGAVRDTRGWLPAPLTVPDRSRSFVAPL